MKSINIISDYKDFYDILSDKNSPITYNRNKSECRQIGTALKYLKGLGVKTIDIKPVSSFSRFDKNIIVYKNPIVRDMNTVEIMDVEYAQSVFPTSVASEYFRSDNNLNLKYLQVGKRRFTITYECCDKSINIGHIIDIRESSSEFNMAIGIPIYSIDYIVRNGVMLATDFNEVENLSNLKLNSIMSAENVIEEIRESLIKYNKV